MYVNMYVHTAAHTCDMCEFVYFFWRVCMCAWVYVRRCVRVCVYQCVFVCCGCVYVVVCVQIYIYMCVYVCECV